MASEREKAGMALGEEEEESRVGEKAKEQPSTTKTGHIHDEVAEAPPLLSQN